MKNKNAFASSVLVLCMLLTACGSAGTTEETTASPVQTNENSAPEATSEYTAPDVDYDGKTFTIASYNMYDAPYKITDYIMSISEENGDFINDAIVSRNRHVEETLGIKLAQFDINYSERKDISRLTKSIVAGDDEFQVIMPMTCALPSLLGTEGMLIDLKTVDTLDLSHSWWDDHANAEYCINGKQYIAVGDICFYGKGAPIVYYFNKQLISDFKMPSPYQLVYDGKWTFDKMNELAVTAAGDLNGDSKIDLSDRFGFMGENSSLTYSLLGAGVRYSTHDAAGNVTITLNTDRTVDMVDKFTTLLNNTDTSICLEAYLNQFNNSVFDLMIPTFLDNRALFFTNQMLVALDLRNMNADFGILPLPKYDEAQETYCGTSNTYYLDNVVIPPTNPDLEMTGYVLEAMGRYSQQEVTPAFIDTTVISKSIRDEDSAEMIRMIYDNQVYDIAIPFDWGGIVNTVNYTLAPVAGANFSSTYASIETAVQTALKTTMETLLK